MTRKDFGSCSRPGRGRGARRLAANRPINKMPVPRQARGWEPCDYKPGVFLPRERFLFTTIVLLLLLLFSHELMATMQSAVTGQAPTTLEW